MDKQVVINRLTELPGEIEERENDLLDAKEALTNAKEALIDKQNELLVTGAIDGKNAEIRFAQMRNLTTQERAQITKAEIEVGLAQVNANRAINQFKAYRAVAKIIHGGGING